MDRIQSSTGAGYFSQAISEFVKNRETEELAKNNQERKNIGDFSEEEWEKLLSKVDNAIEEYKEDIEERKEDALEKKQKQTEAYILGKGTKEHLDYEQNVMMGGAMYSRRFQRLNSGMFSREDTAVEQPDIEDSVTDFVSEEAIQKIIGNRGKAPYSALADENGEVEYNGVIFTCDYDNNRICLGDVSNPDNCISVPLENGGCLVFNRNSIEALSKAIGMFSPEDVNRIMRAIAQDAKVKSTMQEIEDETSGMEILDKKEEEEYFA